MQSMDKNEVDISKLFIWSTELNISAYGNDLKVYLRLVGDAELNRARVYALRRSSELRNKLRASDTDEHYAFLPEFDTITHPELINGLLALSVRDVTGDALKEIKIPLPKEPDSDSTLEQQEEYQRLIDEYPIKRDMEIRKYVEKHLEKLNKQYSTQPKDKLYNTYITKLVNQLCEAEMLSAFREACVFFGLYVDEKFTQRVFNSIEEFNDIPSDLKNILVSSYLELEIEGEVLKKSLAVTQ